MALYFDIEAINGRSVSANGCAVTLDLSASVTDAVRLSMSPSIATELVDTLTALNDEAMLKQGLQAPAVKAGAHRIFEKVGVNLDATGSVLLIDFDRGGAHGVSVAVSIENCQALIVTLSRAAAIARVLRGLRSPEDELGPAA